MTKKHTTGGGTRKRGAVAGRGGALGTGSRGGEGGRGLGGLLGVVLDEVSGQEVDGVLRSVNETADEFAHIVDHGEQRESAIPTLVCCDRIPARA